MMANVDLIHFMAFSFFFQALCMARGAPAFSLVLPTQALAVIGEVFGQREARVVHKASNTRTVAALAIYSALQVRRTALLLSLPVSFS